MHPFIILTFGLVLFFILQLLFFVKRYIRCPPDKILVIYGKISPDPNKKYKIVTSGAEFVWPVIQEYALMNAVPFEVNIKNEVELKNGQQRSINVDLRCQISKKKELTIKAVELFLMKAQSEISEIVHDRLKGKIEK